VRRHRTPTVCAHRRDGSIDMENRLIGSCRLPSPSPEAASMQSYAQIHRLLKVRNTDHKIRV